MKDAIPNKAEQFGYAILRTAAEKQRLQAEDNRRLSEAARAIRSAMEAGYNTVRVPVGSAGYGTRDEAWPSLFAGIADRLQQVIQAADQDGARYDIKGAEGPVGYTFDREAIEGVCHARSFYLVVRWPKLPEEEGACQS